MAEENIWIALVDDWELRGNGLGDVRKHQYDTALQLMDCYDALGVTGTFNVEVMQQIAFEACEERHEDIARQSALWGEAVEAMKRRHFDIQLHIHPQWHDAEYDGSRWRLDRRWDITAYSEEDVERFVSGGVRFLSRFVPREDIVSFRAGSWGIGPPSRPLMASLIRNAIKIDVSIVAGLVYNGDCIDLDYLDLDSPYEPYYPDLDDARRLSKEAHGLVEIPTQSVPLAHVLGMGNPLARAKEFAKPYLRAVQYCVADWRGRRSGRAASPFEVPISPFGVWAKNDFILDFGARWPLRHWLKAIDLVLERAAHAPPPAFLVFENHTKDLTAAADFERITRIVQHIQNRYGDRVKFVQLKDMARSLDLLSPKLADSHGLLN